jgi:hypothetical protein
MISAPSFTDTSSPFYRQEKVCIFLEKNQLSEDLISEEAEAKVKEAGEDYLIRRPDKVEPQGHYDKRLESAVLVNAYADGVDSYSSMIGEAGITLSDKAKNERTEAIFAEADQAGNSFEVFSTSFFRQGIGRGAAYCVIDGPAKTGVQTKDEARKTGSRPWLSTFGPDQLLGWKESSGKVVEVRYYWAETTEAKGYSEEMIWKVREYILNNGSVTAKTWIWDGQLSEPEEVRLSLSVVPVVPFLPGAEAGLMLSWPPASRLAYLTKAYYNSWSLQQNLGVIVRTPLLTVIGASIKEVLHSLAAVFSIDKNKSEADAKYVEPTNVGAEFGWKDLEKIENAFRYWGVELERQNGTVLATTKIIDNSRMVEKVRAWSGDLESTLQQVLVVSEMFYGKTFPKDGVIVGTEYGVPSLTNEQVQLIKLVSDAEGIGGEQLLELLKVYVPQMSDVSWEDVQDSLIQKNQTETFTGLDTGSEG